jgi:ABC-type transport system involved in multi-copper enzyme maturation permease subunit
MSSVSVVLGALRYEFGMQVRRRSIWITLGLIGLLCLSLWSLIAGPALQRHYSPEHHIWIAPSAGDAILGWAQFLGMLLPLGAGLVLADRLARDRTTHMDELLETLPASLGARLAGKFAGSTLATLAAALAIYAALIAYITLRVPQSGNIGLALGAFAAVLVPGILFAAGLSIAVPVVVRVPVYQFLFIGYWFWANLMTPKIGLPSPVGTMLNATGPWAQEGLFHFDWAFLQLQATPAQALASIALLISIGLAALVCGWLWLRLGQAAR